MERNGRSRFWNRNGWNNHRILLHGFGGCAHATQGARSFSMQGTDDIFVLKYEGKIIKLKFKR
jgi:hypothetical protein